MQGFKDLLLAGIRDKGDRLLAGGDFEKAVPYYEMLKGYPIGNTFSCMRKTAAAYEGMGEVGKALEVFGTMHAQGYRSAGFYLEIGLLFENGMGDMEKALSYYKIGADMASSEYEATIGSAYPVVINAGMVPAFHYRIYMKVAQAHLRLGQYQEAVDAVAWAKEIWPDSLLHYQIEAEGLKGLGRTEAVRDTVGKARAIDPGFSMATD